VSFYGPLLQCLPERKKRRAGGASQLLAEQTRKTNTYLGDNAEIIGPGSSRRSRKPIRSSAQSVTYLFEFEIIGICQNRIN
jgi:hypothetical protein